MTEQIKEEEEFEVRDLREKDQYKIDDKFLNGYAKFVSIYGVGVYNSLARHAEFKKQRAFPSAKKMAEELNISTPKVFYSLWALEFFNIIKRKRIGKKCTNRYDLIHKKHWKSSEKSVSQLESDVNKVNNSDVNDINIRYKRHLHHLLTTLTSIVRITNSKDNKRKEEGSSFKKLSFKRKKKPYFRGEEMRYSQNKWWILPGDGSQWLEFVGQEEDIEWK